MMKKSMGRVLVTLIASVGFAAASYAQPAAPAAAKAAPAVQKAAPVAAKAAPVAEKTAAKTVFGKLWLTKDAAGKVTAIELKTKDETGKRGTMKIAIDEKGAATAASLDRKRVKVKGTVEGETINATAIIDAPAAVPVAENTAPLKAAKTEQKAPAAK